MKQENLTKYKLYLKPFNYSQIVYANSLSEAKQKLLAEFGFSVNINMLRTIEETQNIGKLTTKEFEQQDYQVYKKWVLKIKPPHVFIPVTVTTRELKNNLPSYMKVPIENYELLSKFDWIINSDNEPITYIDNSNTKVTTTDIIDAMKFISSLSEANSLFLGEWVSVNESRERQDLAKLYITGELYPAHNLFFPDKKSMYLEKLKENSAWLETLQIAFYLKDRIKSQNISKEKVLIVDDDRTSRRVMEKIIDSYWDCNILLAENGAEALTIMRGSKPNLVILDIMMPIMNGIDCLIEMRSDASLVDIPVIMYSCVADRRVLNSLTELEINSYLLKPVIKENVIEKISPYISSRKPPSAISRFVLTSEKTRKSFNNEEK